MPKAALTIAQLEQLLAKQENRLKELQKKRERLTSQIAKVDAQIASLNGTATAAPKKAARVRKRQGKSLRQHVVDVLKASSQPMTAKDITDAVSKAGYKSSSKDLVTLVRLTCYKSDEIQMKGRGKFAVKGTK